LSWQPISTLSHPCKIQESACVIYRESPDCQMKCKFSCQSDFSRVMLVVKLITFSQTICCCRGLSLDSVATDRPFVSMHGEVPPCGRLEMAFSSDARYLAIFDQSRPKIVWIWDITRLELKALLVQSLSVTCKVSLCKRWLILMSL
jgi:hypothetical protein